MLYLLVAVLFIAVIVGPALWVRRVMRRYGKPEDRYSGTGSALAEHLLAQEGIEGVGVDRAPEGADHYDPTSRTVRLSPSNYDGRSLTAISVAAHEVGHAVQHHAGFKPLMLRSKLVVALAPLERAGAAMLFMAPIIGAVTRAPAPTLLTVLAGFLVLGSSIVVHLVTLPTEIDASFGRALPLLKKHNILHAGDEPHARRILRAAAWTYAAAALVSLFNIARWWAILRR